MFIEIGLQKTAHFSQILRKKVILNYRKFYMGGYIMAITFNAREARDMTDKAVMIADKEDRRKIEELLEKTVIPEIKNAANKGLSICVITVTTEFNIAKFEKVLTEEMGFNVARKNTEFTIRW